MDELNWDDKLRKYRELIKNIAHSVSRTKSTGRSITRAPPPNVRSMSVVPIRSRKSKPTESTPAKVRSPQVCLEVTGFGLLQRNKNQKSVATSNSSISNIPQLQPLCRSSIASGRRRDMEQSIQSVYPSLQLSPLLVDDVDDVELSKHSIHITPPPTSGDNSDRHDAGTSTERGQMVQPDDQKDSEIESVRFERKRITDQLLKAILN